MSNSSKEKLYKEYKLEGPRRFKRKYEEECKKITGTIIYAFQKHSGISSEEYKGFEKEYLGDIKKIKSLFTKKRAEGFGSIIVFYDWYKKQPQHCGYCGVSQDELNQVFKGRDRTNKDKLPLISKDKAESGGRIKRLHGTLEVEKRDSDKEYNEENCILACPLCNNAKSNLINEDHWTSFFVEPMREYYMKLLGKDLENPKPEFKTSRR